MLRDKTYLRTKSAMLFNVTGYRHPQRHVYASLKYVDGQKWKLGYEAAKTYLSREHPEYVDQFIRVPRAEVTQIYDPQTRWAGIKSTARPGPLHAEALELERALRRILEIPASDNKQLAGKPFTGKPFDSEMGITDSLLWGDGHPASDIDLVVIGRANAQRLLQRGHLLYDLSGRSNSDFQRPDPQVMESPYGSHVPNWPDVLARKSHMGSFRGRLFSVRAIYSVEELASMPQELPLEFEQDSFAASNRQTVEFEVANASDSLFFPAIYRNQAGDELVDYSVIYEGVYRPGDIVRCHCYRENVQQLDAQRPGKPGQVATKTRFVIDGECQLLSAAS